MPADQGLRFYYSLNSASFVDLRPEMQLRVETISASGRDQQSKSDEIQLSVISQPPLGVALEQNDKSGKSKVLGESSYRTLPQEFRKYPHLRLFLEQAETSIEEARRAVLLGVINPDALDRETWMVQRNPQNQCQVASRIGACVFFSDSGVSLLTPVFLNGHAASYPSGMTLSQLIGALPQKREARALATVSLYLRYQGGSRLSDYPGPKKNQGTWSSSAGSHPLARVKPGPMTSKDTTNGKPPPRFPRKPDRECRSSALDS